MSTDRKTALPKERISRRAQLLNPVEVLMPDIYAEESPIDKGDHHTTHEARPEEQETPIIDKSEGFDPYDTGALYKK